MGNLITNFPLIPGAIKSGLELLRRSGARDPQLRAPLLPVQRIPTEAERLFLKRAGSLDKPIDPQIARAWLEQVAPKDTIEMLYGDALGRGRFANSDIPLSFNDLQRGMHRPDFKLISPTNDFSARSPHRGYFDEQRANEFSGFYAGNQHWPATKTGPQYFERALIAPNDMTMMGLPEQIFELSHYNNYDRPILGHMRGSYQPRGTFAPFKNMEESRARGPDVFIEELQSDPLQLLSKLQAQGKVDPNIPVPAILQNIYPNLAKAALQRSAQMGASTFNIVTPEAAALAREEKHVSPFLQKIYGNILQKQFYNPLEKELGTSFITRINEMDPESSMGQWLNNSTALLPDNNTLLKSMQGKFGYPYRSLDLTPEMREYIIRKGLSGFRQGGYV